MTGSIDVELEIAGRPGEGNGGVIANDLGDYLGHGLSHHRVDLSRHYRATRLQIRDPDLGQARAGPAAHPANVVAHL